MNGSKRLIIVPNRGLAILPLHACWWEENGEVKYLPDEYVCTYAPRVYILKRGLGRRRELTEQDKLFGLANPTCDLAFAEWECEETGGLFGNSNGSMLWREQATRKSLFERASQHQLLHFSGHGIYSLDALLHFALLLADAKLELNEIIARLDLRHTWLTVLAACEPSLSDFRKIADEQYGKPIGFLVAGTPTVWGRCGPSTISQWHY
jgi:CHAT domain-containing protein